MRVDAGVLTYDRVTVYREIVKDLLAGFRMPFDAHQRRLTPINIETR